MSNFIFDIDGTLRNFELEPDIDPNLHLYLSRLRVNNHLYAVTGRTYKNFQNFLNELNAVVDNWEIINSLFEIVFCEDGHLCYKSDSSNCLIGKSELKQIQKVREYVNHQIKKPPYGYYLSYPEKDLLSEIIITVQEKEGALSFKQHLDNYIFENKLNKLIVKELTHKRLSISIKGVGKKSAIGVYNLDLADSYYFCDEENDLELAIKVVKSGGKVVCPSNAIQKIKDIAYFVSRKPFSYGVVDFLSSLFDNSSN